MKNSFILFLIMMLLSCNQQREVQLPHTTHNAITEVQDVSPVYLFYDELNDTVIFNKKNLISTTNWLVNIDKRLTLKQVLPHLQFLQEKRKKSSMHKNEAARNYFTCFNPETKGLSFIDFTQDKYVDSLGINDLKWKPSEATTENALISIYFGQNEDVIVVVNNDSMPTISSSKSNFMQLLDSLIKIDVTKKQLHIEYDESLTVQDFITYKSDLMRLDSNHVDLDSINFIHN